MTILRTEPGSRVHQEVANKVHVVYRDGSGAIHWDLNADEIRKAIDDGKGTLWVDVQE